MKAYLHSSWLKNFRWTQALSVLLLFHISPELQAKVSSKHVKTPAEATVAYQVSSGYYNMTLCYGARLSQQHLVTSTPCMQILKSYWRTGSVIHARASSGMDYGEVTDTGNNVQNIADMDGVEILTLKYPYEEELLWPSIDMSEPFEDSDVSVHRQAGQDRKRSIASSLNLEGCEEEQCLLQQVDNDGQPLGEGEPVFKDGQLLCLNSGTHCIRVRSVLAKRAIDSNDNCNITSRSRHAARSHVEYTCKNCKMQDSGIYDIGTLPGCLGDPCTGSVTKKPGETTKSHSCDYSTRSKWIIAVLTVSSVLVVTAICVSPCIICFLCITGRCPDCCKSCGSCMRSRAERTNHFPMSDMGT